MISRTRYSKVIRLHSNAVLLGIVFEEVCAKISTRFARSTQGAGLAALVGPAIINNAIDSFVTPQGIASLLRIAKVPVPNGDPRPSSTLDDKQRDRLQFEQVEYAFFSGGPLTFRVDIATDIAQSAQQPVTTCAFQMGGRLETFSSYFAAGGDPEHSRRKAPIILIHPLL